MKVFDPNSSDKNQTADFYVVGVIPINFDTPSFCTPIFRRDDGARYYLQSLVRKTVIKDFIYVGDQFSSESYSEIRGNRAIRKSDAVLVGFRYLDGSTIVDTKKIVLERLLDDAERFLNFPFLYLSLARQQNSLAMIKRALSHPEIQNAISKKWISIPKHFRGQNPNSWSKEDADLLVHLWKKGNSIASIAREIGKSRNSVAGKAKRLGLPTRLEDILGPPLKSRSVG
ncbi:GcrA family cell cycle regulator [Neorhizobium galegae]|uniref:Uncharacterized protein n=1 Tax=Neorhizobium galegae bv. officinalis TaxID=323656 RepID=A0A0T7GI90_NEOGA|nr:GcrA family cell cycle regulator [Neorhizobium galegae]CDZ46970.1 Hypothetical protein NGAL_HAMBI1189_16770 [Neorhizobium galegae bv. officinalis]